MNDLTTEHKQALEAVLRRVKKHMKPRSKNELIRIIGALLVENHFFRQMLEAQGVGNAQQGSESNIGAVSSTSDAPSGLAG